MRCGGGEEQKQIGHSMDRSACRKRGRLRELRARRSIPVCVRMVRMDERSGGKEKAQTCYGMLWDAGTGHGHAVRGWIGGERGAREEPAMGVQAVDWADGGDFALSGAKT